MNRKKIPLFQQIADWLSEGIHSRRFQPGGEIPSESELCKQFSGSRSSVRKALELLERDQLIFRRPGVGSFVRDVNAEPAEALLNIGVSNLNNVSWYTADIFAGAAAACTQANAQLVFVDINEYLSTRRIPLDGLLVLGGEEVVKMGALEQVAANGLPVALLNRFTDLPHISYFSVDYEREAEKAIAFMRTQQSRRICAVYYPQDSKYALQTRLRGFDNACRNLGLEPLHCPISAPLGGAGEICEYVLAHDCDGIFLPTCARLTPALEAQRALSDRKLMLMCFDKISPELINEAEIAWIEMPLYDLAYSAVSSLVERHRNHGVPIVRKLYDSRFILSSSRFNTPNSSLMSADLA